MDAVITDAADDRALFYVEDDDFPVGAVRGIFHAKLHVFEKLRVPQSLEIAAQGLFVVDVAFTAEDAGFEGVAANAAVADEVDAVDDETRLSVAVESCVLRSALRGGLRRVPVRGCAAIGSRIGCRGRVGIRE